MRTVVSHACLSDRNGEADNSGQFEVLTTRRQCGKVIKQMVGLTAPRNREQEIVQAAVELFAIRGYEKTSMEDIAGSIGILKGSLYHYITSKRDLLAKALLGLTVELRNGLDEIVESQASSSEKLRCAFRHHVEFFFEDYPRACVFLEERLTALASMQRRRVVRERNQYESVWRRLVAEGIERGEFRADLDVAMMVRGMLGMCNWMIKWFRLDGKWSPLQVADLFAEMVVQGIQTVPCQSRQPHEIRKTKRQNFVASEQSARQKSRF